MFRGMVCRLLYPVLAVLLMGAAEQAQHREREPAVMRASNIRGLGVPQRLTDELTITPVSIVEDSRCPSDVLCIQAGQLVVSVRIERGGDSTLRNIALGASTLTPGGVILFADAGERRTRAEINAGPHNYDFAFTFAPNTAL